MVRQMRSDPRVVLAALQATMGDRQFKDALDPSNINDDNNLEVQSDDTSRTGTTRTDRAGNPKSSTSTSSTYQTDLANAPVQGPVKTSSATTSGNTSNVTSSTTDAFTQGMQDAYGTGTSNLLASWGVAPAGYNDLDYSASEDDANFFNYMWEQQYGNNPLMDGSDVQMMQAQQTLGLMNGQALNGWDDMGGRLDNLSSPGGTYMTLAEASSLALNPSMLEQYGLSDDDGIMTNALILGSVRNTYPSNVLGAVSSRLKQSQKEYKAALLTGSFTGSYAEYLQSNGTAAWLGGL